MPFSVSGAHNGHVEPPGRANASPTVRSNVRFAAEAVQDFSITVSGPKNTKHKVLKPGPLPLVLDHENLYC